MSLGFPVSVRSGNFCFFSVSEGEWGYAPAVFLAHFPERGISDYIAHTVSFYGYLLVLVKSASSVSPR